jgi:asparagine synthase (glutamine-hydrolysing)
MCDAMIHRGPDDVGQMDLQGVCLGMRRLAILDLSPQGHQPMSNEDDSVWMVYNGEIYNYRELRAGLEQRGHRFRSKTDSETIVHLYEEHGAGLLDHLRGMFALAVWDVRKRRLLLARDRLGIKPLYYARLSDGVMFASEVQALLASGQVERRLDRVALDHYLAFGYVPPPRTLIEGICSLSPGYLASYDDDELTVRRWWAPAPSGATECPEDQAPVRLRALLEESIRLHRVSDVPVGAFLSGGLDSTAVVGLMSHVLSEPVRTFSVGFTEGPDRLNELSTARAVAEAFGAEHTEVFLTGEDVSAGINDVIAHIDQPSFDGVNTYFVSRAARHGGLTVALSGLGGDELFGGYGTFDVVPRFAQGVRVWGRLPAAARRVISGAARDGAWLFGRRGERARKLGRLQYVDSAVTAFALARLLRWPDEMASLYTPDAAEQLGKTQGPNALDLLGSLAPRNARPWELVTTLDLTAFMSWRLLRDTDVMSMASSLEVRVPLIDHRVVEFVCGLPPGWERRFGYPKRLLRESLSDIFPPAVLGRPKQGFELPLGTWMRGSLRPILDDALSTEAVRRRGLFRPEAVARVQQDFLRGTESYTQAWQLVVLELWMRRVLDAPNA